MSIRFAKLMVQIAPMAVPKELMVRIDEMLARLHQVRPWEERSKTAFIRELLFHGLA